MWGKGTTTLDFSSGPNCRENAPLIRYFTSVVVQLGADRREVTRSTARQSACLYPRPFSLSAWLAVTRFSWTLSRKRFYQKRQLVVKHSFVTAQFFALTLDFQFLRLNR